MSDGERVLVARQSAFQTILLTEDALGLRSLRFGEGEGRQSVVKVGDPSHLEMPYARMLPAALAFVPHPARMLIVGLGGGTLPSFFHHHFPELSIDVVELDPGVVEVAKEFCGLQENGRLRVHVADGRDFVESSGGGYDVIILDCFDANSIPAHLSTLEFLHSVRKGLSMSGVAVANIWGRGHNPLYADMLLTYGAAFEDVYVIDVKLAGTKIFVALGERQEMSRDELIRVTREMGMSRKFTYNLSNEIGGFRDARLERVKGGTVLHD